VIDVRLEPEMFPSQMQNLAEAVIRFLNSLNEFPEFTDEALNSSILTFQADLKVSSDTHSHGEFKISFIL
jgi:hypothetical protein